MPDSSNERNEDGFFSEELELFKLKDIMDIVENEHVLDKIWGFKSVPIWLDRVHFFRTYQMVFLFIYPVLLFLKDYNCSITHEEKNELLLSKRFKDLCTYFETDYDDMEECFELLTEVTELIAKKGKYLKIEGVTNLDLYLHLYDFEKANNVVKNIVGNLNKIIKSCLDTKDYRTYLKKIPEVKKRVEEERKLIDEGFTLIEKDGIILIKKEELDVLLRPGFS